MRQHVAVIPEVTYSVKVDMDMKKINETALCSDTDQIKSAVLHSDNTDDEIKTRTAVYLDYETTPTDKNTQNCAAYKPYLYSIRFVVPS